MTAPARGSGWIRGGAPEAEDGNLHPRRFERWLGQFLAGGFLARAVAEPGVRIHVLWVGQAATPGRAGLERAVHAALPGAGFHTFHEPGALAAGAHNFLDRHLRNLPTYRDDVPDLYLEVSLGQWKKEQICIFSSKEPVRPGQVIEKQVDTKFRLPKGKHSYRFPLLRGRGTPMPSAFEAKLVDPSFPLRQETEVVLKVEFRYAQDAFNVWVLPVHPGPLGPCRIEWVRGDAAPEAELPRQNERPSFPETSNWSALGEQVPDSLEAQWREFAEAFDATFDKRHIEKLASLEGQRSRAKALKELEKLLKGVDETCSQLWRNDRVAHAPPPQLMALANRTFLPRVRALADPRSARGITIPRTYQRRLESQLDGVRPHALLLLCRLRAQAPDEAIDALIEEMEADSRATRGINPLHCMGWALADGRSPARQRAVERVVDFLARSAEVEDWPRVEEALWALSTAAWSHPDFVGLLSASTVERILGAIRRVLLEFGSGHVVHDRDAKLFHEAGQVVLGLLRLRGDAAGAGLAAGTVALDHLADEFERAAGVIGTKLAADWPRLQFDADGEFLEALTGSLRGHRTAHVRMLEEK